MTITANGKVFFADQIGPRAQYPVSLMAIGTGMPAAAALGAEIPGKRHSVTPSSSGAIATYQAHWDVDDQFAAGITEVGLFNNNGTMIASESFASVPKSINDPFNVTINVPIL